MPHPEVKHAVPPRHSFLEGIHDEAPGQELEAKLGFASFVEPGETISQITSYMATHPDILVVEEPFKPVINTVHKYATDEGKSFSVIERPDGARFVKRKPFKIKRPDGVIVAEETKMAWDTDDAFPEETGILLESSELIGTIKRHKDGVFVQISGRVYQIVLDTVRYAPGSNGSDVPEQVLQQLEIEYKGIQAEAAPEAHESKKTAAIDSVARDVVHIRDLAQSCLADIGIATKITTMSKTKWLRKAKRSLPPTMVEVEPVSAKDTRT